MECGLTVWGWFPTVSTCCLTAQPLSWVCMPLSCHAGRQQEYFLTGLYTTCYLQTQEGRKEGNVLFNNTLNAFYLRLYGIIHMVKDHSDSERGNPLPPHGLLFPISSKGSFICTIPETGQHIPRIWYTSRGALAGTRNSWLGPPWRIDPTTHRVMSEHSYHGATSRSLQTHSFKKNKN